LCNKDLTASGKKWAGNGSRVVRQFEKEARRACDRCGKKQTLRFAQDDNFELDLRFILLLYQPQPACLDKVSEFIFAVWSLS
jgi:hypothetical protein